jgi:hypothetical protein
VGEVVVRTGLRLQGGSILEESPELQFRERSARSHVGQVARESKVEVVITGLAPPDLGEDVPNLLMRDRAATGEVFEQGDDEQIGH